MNCGLLSRIIGHIYRLIQMPLLALNLYLFFEGLKEKVVKWDGDWRKVKYLELQTIEL
jgi:hypothetical protein